MKALKLFASAVIVAMSTFSAAANATIMTFDSLEQAGTGYQFMPSYSENGFTLSAASLLSARQGNTGWYFGSASLFNNYSNGVTTLTKDGGGTFSINSIDLAPVATSYGGGAMVSFIGSMLGGGTVNASFTLNDTFTFQTFAFNGFSNLSSVSWTQTHPYHQFDNIALDVRAVSPVPEPETYAMLLAGLGLIGFMTRNRKKSSQA